MQVATQQRFLAAVGLIVSALLSSQSVHAVLIADSVSEFSGTQGQDNWFYGYYDGGLTSSDFKQLPLFVANVPVFPPGSGFGGATWAIDADFSNPPWVELVAIGGHPDHTSSGGITRWVVRRWISETTGQIEIAGNLAHLNNLFGDGVTGRIIVDSVEVFSSGIARGDTVGVDYRITPNVHIGSTVDFVIDPDGLGPGVDNLSDQARFTASIQAVPEPSAIILLVIGFLGVVTMRHPHRTT